MRGKLFSTLLLVLAIAATPHVAQALVLNVVSGEVGIAQLCSDSLCTNETLAFDDGGATSGTITVAGGNVSFSIDVSVIGFSGGPDGTVTDLELQSLTYTASPVAITGTPDDFTAAGNAAVSGTVSPTPGSTSPLSIASAPYTISCVDESGQLKCGIVMLGFPTFSVQVDGQTRYVPHTLNPTAVPEPQASVMMLTAGLLGLAYRGRKATS
jgi:hypothetical protein